MANSKFISKKGQSPILTAPLSSPYIPGSIPLQRIRVKKKKNQTKPNQSVLRPMPFHADWILNSLNVSVHKPFCLQSWIVLRWMCHRWLGYIGRIVLIFQSLFIYSQGDHLGVEIWREVKQVQESLIRRPHGPSPQFVRSSLCFL